MLKSLFGCKSIEKILFFLLVNEKCYAHQLQQMLDITLTPIQKALSRLEKGGVVSSHYEGKIRLYQFDSTFPLLDELELLLRKAYNKLPIDEKKAYYYVKSVHKGVKKKNYEILQGIWNHLKNVSRVTLLAKSCSNEPNRWYRKGVGTVNANHENQSIIF